MNNQPCNNAISPKLQQHNQCQDKRVIKLAWILLTLSFMLFMSIVVSTTFGSSDLKIQTIISIITNKLIPDSMPVIWNKGQESIVWFIRLPRILLAVLVGAGLALVGTCLQAVTRNPMADPYLFGASAGASLGAVLVISHADIFIAPFNNILSIPVAAFIGALISMLMVLYLAKQGQSLSQQKLILSGVAIHFMLMSVTNYLIFVGDQRIAGSALFWMLGGLGAAQWSQLIYPLIALCLALPIMLSWANSLNAIMAGDETAITLGINVNGLRFMVFLLCALVTGTMVAFSGAIGFVGLMVPHIVRIFVGADNNKVLPVSALVGALLLVWADALGRTLIAPQDLPVGIVTSVIGGGFFVYLMAKK
ncbi:FecCD family ABC transporter permease [Moritella yayanosii]|uniref:Putative Haemin ABC transporter, permease protein n=1 Tax=Moritella yayanosii TaxID=69539 RepID=A0A330LHK4_9GAMM|nr:iron ABC transporter permease [Moritella yayanosii]SQD76657.1 putative Haemin ABC transporter, permease protein [Moritella yayanosii]